MTLAACLRALPFFFLLDINSFSKNVQRTAQHWTASLLSNKKINLTFANNFPTFCPLGVQVAQTVVHFAHFQVQARKRGVLGWGWGCFGYVHIPNRGV